MISKWSYLCFYFNYFKKHSYISAVFHEKIFHKSWFKGKRKNTILHVTDVNLLVFYCTLSTLVWLHFSKTGYDVAKRTGEASHVNEQLRRTVKEPWMLGSWMWADMCYRRDVQKHRHLQKCDVREAGRVSGSKGNKIIMKWVGRWWVIVLVWD